MLGRGAETLLERYRYYGLVLLVRMCMPGGPMIIELLKLEHPEPNPNMAHMVFVGFHGISLGRSGNERGVCWGGGGAGH